MGGKRRKYRIAYIRKVKKKDIAALVYIVSLLPMLLPWCYFDEGIDGIKYGIDIVNQKVFIVLAVATFFSLLFAESPKAKCLAKIFLLLHVALYLFCALFWYVPLLTDFNLLLSLEAAHSGVYLSVLSIGLVYLFYRKD